MHRLVEAVEKVGLQRIWTGQQITLSRTSLADSDSEHYGGSYE
jgi:hypothetical protein